MTVKNFAESVWVKRESGSDWPGGAASSGHPGEGSSMDNSDLSISNKQCRHTEMYM